VDGGDGAGISGASAVKPFLQRWRGRAHLLAAFEDRFAPVNECMTEEGGDALILPDHVHPSQAGHEKIAAIFAGATQY
jgi:lysophospholipase L1-like esterase